MATKTVTSTHVRTKSVMKAYMYIIKYKNLGQTRQSMYELKLFENVKIMEIFVGNDTLKLKSLTFLHI